MTTVSALLLMVFVEVELYGAIAHSPSPVCDTNIMYQTKKLMLHSQFIDLSNRFFVRITMVAHFCFLNAKTEAFNKLTEQFKDVQQIELHSRACVTTQSAPSLCHCVKAPCSLVRVTKISGYLYFEIYPENISSRVLRNINACTLDYTLSPEHHTREPPRR